MTVLEVVMMVLGAERNEFGPERERWVGPVFIPFSGFEHHSRLVMDPVEQFMHATGCTDAKKAEFDIADADGDVEVRIFVENLFSPIFLACMGVS